MPTKYYWHPRNFRLSAVVVSNKQQEQSLVGMSEAGEGGGAGEAHPQILAWPLLLDPSPHVRTRPLPLHF